MNNNNFYINNDLLLDPDALATYLFGGTFIPPTNEWECDLITPHHLPPSPPSTPDLTSNNKQTSYRAIAPAHHLLPLPPPPPPMRKRKQPEEPEDLALKRQKNTDAARRSRLKKMVKMETLEARVATLESENNGLATRISVLAMEKSGLESKTLDLTERIKVLEAQLAEAHQGLAILS
ncbi:hypothetical protein BC941DRAFT_413452 [Chlamydoabsidia padenii]|nr:hypothetical protein BC941DRAFT_413452 [Chlamydoabsidia padenii]